MVISVRARRQTLFAVLAVLIAGSIAGLWFGLLRTPADPGGPGLDVASVEANTAGGNESELRSPEKALDSSTAAKLEEREAAPPPPKTGLSVTVRRNDGRVVEYAEVNALAGALIRARCDEKGRAVMAVEPGTYEVFVPSRAQGDAQPVYPPEGRSSVEAVVTAGNLTEVELLVYGGAVLHFQFVDAAGNSQGMDRFALFKFDGERWFDPFDRSQHGLPSGVINGLEGGTYGIAPSSFSRSWFEPSVVEVLLGEKKTVTLTCVPWRKLKLDVRVRAELDGPPLPIWIAANATSLKERILPVPEGFTQFAGKARSPNEIAFDVVPGPVRLTFSTVGWPLPCLQIVEPRTWSCDVEVPAADGVMELPPFEYLLESVGDIATVNGRLAGSRGRKGTGYHLDYRLPDGSDRRAYVHPHHETESFRIVVDLDLVEGGVITLFEAAGSQRTFVESLQLSPGEQTWDVTLPPR